MIIYDLYFLSNLTSWNLVVSTCRASKMGIFTSAYTFSSFQLYFYCKMLHLDFIISDLTLVCF